MTDNNDASTNTDSAMDAHFRSKDGPHAKAKAAALRAAIERDYNKVSASVREFASAMIKLREAADLDETVRRAERFAQAASKLQVDAGVTLKDANEALFKAAELPGSTGDAA